MSLGRFASRLVSVLDAAGGRAVQHPQSLQHLHQLQPSLQQLRSSLLFCSSSLRRYATDEENSTLFTSSNYSGQKDTSGTDAITEAVAGPTDAVTAEGADTAAAEGKEQPDKVEWTPEEAILVLSDDLSQNVRPRRKSTRAERSSYSELADEVLEELEDIAAPFPDNVPLYDLREASPHLTEPTTPQFDALLAYGRENLDRLMQQFSIPDQPPPQPGARLILHWQVRMVMDVSSAPSHPANRKAVCRVYLRDLQQETGLTDDALKHIALIAGPRYNENNGELKLVSEKYKDREENRRHIIEMLHDLVDAGKRAYPSSKAVAA